MARASPAWPNSLGASPQLPQPWASLASKGYRIRLGRFASLEGRAWVTSATLLNLHNRSSRKVKHFVTLTKARSSRPRLFLSWSFRGASIPAHAQASRHQNWTESVTGGSRFHIFVRLISHHYARSIRSSTW